MKQCLTLFALVITLSVQAQNFFQDFETAIAPMVVFDVDDQTPAPNVAAYTDAWNRANPSFGNGTFVAVSTSWYTPVGRADDWMVTPLIQLPDSNAIVRWDAKAQDVNFRDGYTVYISTTGNTPADFTDTVFTIAAEQATWQTRVVSLNEYAGQQVYVAFRNNSNDMFLLLMDNIFIGEQKQRDIAVLRIQNSGISSFTSSVGERAVVALEGMRTLGITVQNFGVEAVTSLDATWNYNGTSVTQNVSGINVASGASYTFTHTTPIEFIVGNTNSLTVVVDNINGIGDELPDDNDLTIANFKVLPPVPNVVKTSSDGEPIDLHAILASGKVVILDYFASWCGPCVTSTPLLNSLYVNNGAGEEKVDVIGITIEGTDTDAIVNGLPWGSTYPLISYQLSGLESYIHYDVNLGLGGGAIPFFVMICPNIEDPAYSDISVAYVGIDNLSNVFNNTWQPAIDACIESLPSAVKDIPSIESFSVLPNPANDYLNLEFSLTEPTAMVVEVVDITGKSLVRQPLATYPAGENIETIDVSNFVSGTYFVRLTNQNAVKTLKFTVIH